jgi:hypothetical protein
MNTGRLKLRMVQMIISGNKWKHGKITEQNSKKQLINEYKENLNEAISLALRRFKSA